MNSDETIVNDEKLALLISLEFIMTIHFVQTLIYDSADSILKKERKKKLLLDIYRTSQLRQIGYAISAAKI